MGRGRTKAVARYRASWGKSQAAVQSPASQMVGEGGKRLGRPTDTRTQVLRSQDPDGQIWVHFADELGRISIGQMSVLGGG